MYTWNLSRTDEGLKFLRITIQIPLVQFKCLIKSFLTVRILRLRRSDSCIIRKLNKFGRNYRKSSRKVKGVYLLRINKISSKSTKSIKTTITL